MANTGRPGPHDALFRLVIGDPANAASALRCALPENVIPLLDLDRLERVPGNYVDGELSTLFSDLVFRAPVHDEDTYAYVLVEHQSTNDPLMAFRMLHYTVRLWDQHLTDNRTTTIPPVIPLVVSHNTTWTAPTRLLDVVHLADRASLLLDPVRPGFRYHLDDLATTPTTDLLKRTLTPATRVTYLLLKEANGNTRLADVLHQVEPDLRAVLALPGGVQILRAFINYAVVVGDTPTPDLIHFFTQLEPAAKEAYMTTADMLRSEGRAETLIDQLAMKFGPLPQHTLDTVRNATPEQLHTWTGRILTAESLDDALS